MAPKVRKEPREHHAIFAFYCGQVFFLRMTPEVKASQREV